MDNCIEFTHTNKSFNKQLLREVHSNPIDLKTLKKSTLSHNFSGVATVYEAGKMTWKVNVVEGKFHGKIVKYIPFVPNTLLGTATGYITGWRQPVFEGSFRMDLLDGNLFMYRQDGTKHFVFNYNMGLLDGEQKHYVEYSKFVHNFEKGEWIDSEKISKSWLWGDNSDTAASLVEVKRNHELLKVSL